MLGDRRIVVVLRAERLLKPKRASKAADSEPADDETGGGVEETAADAAPLEDYLQSPAPSTTLVFVAADIDKSRRFTKRLLERAQTVEFGGFSGDSPAARREARVAAVELAQAELGQAGRAIDRAALQMLVDRAGDNISKLRGDLERLILYTEGQTRISADDVAEVVALESGGGDDWALVNAIADGDAPRALRAVSDQLDGGGSAHQVVGQLRWWVANRLAEAEPDRVQPAIDALLRTDLALKSSGGDDRVLLERLVVELVGRPVARRW
jgi:DNA polymerase III delta subunit